MKYRLRVRSKALTDVAEKALWYESRAAGLGKDFILCFDAAISQIRRNPLIYVKYHEEFRRALLRRFPVGVFYLVVDDLISIVSVVDLRQGPEKIRKSL